MAGANAPAQTLLDEQRRNNVNPAALTGDLFAIEPAAQHIQRHHGADFLTHRQTVASDAHFDPQSPGPLRRRQRDVKVFLIQPTHEQRQTGKMFNPSLRGPAGGLREGLLLERHHFAGQQRRAGARQLQRQQATGELLA